jgi:hypothetical protein
VTANIGEFLIPQRGLPARQQATIWLCGASSSSMTVKSYVDFKPACRRETDEKRPARLAHGGFRLELSKSKDV